MIDFLKMSAAGLLGGLIVFIGLSLASPVVVPAGGTTNYDDLSVTSITNTGAYTGSTGSFSSTLDITGATNLGDLTVNGGVLSTSTAATSATLVASDLQYGLLQVTVNLSDLTYTLPASSTLTAFVPNAGDVRTLVVYNATSTAGIDVIFAAGTGVDIKSTSASGALTIDEDSLATLTFVRKANSDIEVLMAVPDAD